jgi:hypothetical protein
MALSVALGAWAKGSASTSKPGKAASKPVTTVHKPASSQDQQTMQLTNLRIQVTRQGVTQENIRARWGLMEETNQVIHMRGATMAFYHDGKPNGQIDGGEGTLWLTDRPAEGIARDDMLLTQDVTFRSEEGWAIKSPQMRYDSRASEIRSSSGFTKIMQSGDQSVKATGQSFEIGVDRENGSMRYAKEHGFPLFYQAIEKPEHAP